MSDEKNPGQPSVGNAGETSSRSGAKKPPKKPLRKAVSRVRLREYDAAQAQLIRGFLMNRMKACKEAIDSVKQHDDAVLAKWQASMLLHWRGTLRALAWAESFIEIKRGSVPSSKSKKPKCRTPSETETSAKSSPPAEQTA